jgi:hypothetical protein
MDDQPPAPGDDQMTSADDRSGPVDAGPGGRAAEPAGVAGDPGAVAPTLPSIGARVVGFVAILLAGAAGGFIGYAVADLQCDGDCGVSRGVSGLVGAAIAAIGVAIVVQLALRAMHEWRVIEARGGPEAERQRRRAREVRQPPTSRPRPRVR